MVSCPSAAAPPFVCPPLEQSIHATAALLPGGKAWPANDGGATIDNFLAWLAGLGAVAPALNAWPAGYVQAGFIAAVGTVRNWIEARFCDLKNEFFCATADETLDLWNQEYGLPDQCDPFPNLCIKVATFGGSSCSYWATIAAALGWSIVCYTYTSSVGAQAGCVLAGNGAALASEGIQATVVDINVYLAESSAYTSAIVTPPLAGLMLAGLQLACLPEITPLTCAFDRIMPAHLTVNYTVIEA